MLPDTAIRNTIIDDCLCRSIRSHIHGTGFAAPRGAYSIGVRYRPVVTGIDLDQSLAATTTVTLMGRCVRSPQSLGPICQEAVEVDVAEVIRAIGLPSDALEGHSI